MHWYRRGGRWADRSGFAGRLRALEKEGARSEYRGRWTSDVLVRAPALDAPSEMSDGPRTLLFIASSDETAAALFHGPVGRDWIAWAAAHGVHLAAAGIRDVVGAALMETVDSLCAELATSEVVLCARGDVAVTLHLAFPQASVPAVTGMILVGSFDAPGPVMPRVPTLLVGAGSGRAPDPDHVERIAGGTSLLLLDLTLRKDVEDWLIRQWSCAESQGAR